MATAEMVREETQAVLQESRRSDLIDCSTRCAVVEIEEKRIRMRYAGVLRVQPHNGRRERLGRYVIVDDPNGKVQSLKTLARHNYESVPMIIWDRCYAEFEDARWTGIVNPEAEDRLSKAGKLIGIFRNKGSFIEYNENIFVTGAGSLFAPWAVRATECAADLWALYKGAHLLTLSRSLDEEEVFPLVPGQGFAPIREIGYEEFATLASLHAREEEESAGQEEDEE